MINRNVRPWELKADNENKNFIFMLIYTMGCIAIILTIYGIIVVNNRIAAADKAEAAKLQSTINGAQVPRSELIKYQQRPIATTYKILEYPCDEKGNPVIARITRAAGANGN